MAGSSSPARPRHAQFLAASVEPLEPRGQGLYALNDDDSAIGGNSESRFEGRGVISHVFKKWDRVADEISPFQMETLREQGAVPEKDQQLWASGGRGHIADPRLRRHDPRDLGLVERANVERLDVLFSTPTGTKKNRRHPGQELREAMSTLGQGRVERRESCSGDRT